MLAQGRAYLQVKFYTCAGPSLGVKKEPNNPCLYLFTAHLADQINKVVLPIENNQDQQN